MTRGQQFHRHDIEPRQAVTNRLKLVVEFLSRAFEEYRDERETRLLSVASGSAQAVIGAMRKAPQKIDLVYEPHRIHGIAVCRK